MSARTYNLYKPKKYGNVQVQLSEDKETIKVYLHDHNVLSFNPRTKELVLNACEWHTMTTTTAINTALKQIDLPYYVFRKDGMIFVSGFENVFEKVQFLSAKMRVTSVGLEKV